MNWTAFASPQWQPLSHALAASVRRDVIDILNRGGDIVTGGAPGVDHIAISTALEIDPTAKHLHVILPTSLETYSKHLAAAARAGRVDPLQAQSLTEQFEFLKRANPGVFVEMNRPECDAEAYRIRNDLILETANTLFSYKPDGAKQVVKITHRPPLTTLLHRAHV